MGGLYASAPDPVASARFLLRAADRLAAAVAHRIDLGHLDARSEVGDALLDYDSLNDHRAAVGIEPREGSIGTGLEPRVLDAQRHNATRMKDKHLLREFQQVALYSEQPSIRVAYLNTLRDEIARRGLTEPTL